MSNGTMHGRPMFVAGAVWAAAAGTSHGCASGVVPSQSQFGDTDPSLADTGDTGGLPPPASDSVDEGPDDGPGNTSVADTGEPACPVGSDGCPCTMGGACDPGLGCTDDVCSATPSVCGNGVIETGEACDDGADNDDTGPCKSDCTAQSCGDGFVGPNEACDDGNAENDDACTNACALASCGDGMVQAPEECDDANAVDTDACLSTCLQATCGDGILWTDQEACDDGNPNETDACTNFCTPAVCGDGIQWSGVEACDDGNVAPSDGCTAQCQCAWDFETAAQTSGWIMTGGWAAYTQAPLSSSPAVPFTTQGTVVGTDGNRAAPYPGAEVEVSSLTTTDFVLPGALEFLSWHVDEGGISFDRKQILVSTDGGGSWTTVLDCAAGPGQMAPFCTLLTGPRDAADWDLVSVDIAAFAGQVGRIQFTYDTGDACCSFEQGWYIDVANLLSCP